jgi:glycosyltransferase involved in cell wall biosynthesis
MIEADAPERPEVSIIIATRDRWSTLVGNALPSALSQQGVSIEIVVVDDGSADGTAQHLAQLDDERIRVVRNEVSLRLPGARNVGIAAAGGDWLAFLDDDDLWSPRKLRAQLDAAAAAGAGWVFGRAIVVDELKRLVEADPFPDPEDLPTLLLRGNWIPGGGSNVIARADLVRGVGGFDDELLFFEDWDLWLRLLATGLPAACDDVLVARMEHEQNMVLRDHDRVLPAFERLLGKHKAVTRDDRLSVAQWLAYEQHRAGKRMRASALYLRAAFAYRSPGNLPAALGALFGERGVHAASKVLLTLGGSSHLERPEPDVPPEPDWLQLYRRASRTSPAAPLGRDRAGTA